jgi:hypothetical protein
MKLLKRVVYVVASLAIATYAAFGIDHAFAYLRHPAPQHQPGTQYLTIQIWSQTVTTDQATATYRNASKIAEFKADGSWEEVTDLTDEQKQIIAERLKVMTNNWIYGQNLK